MVSLLIRKELEKHGIAIKHMFFERNKIEFKLRYRYVIEVSKLNRIYVYNEKDDEYLVLRYTSLRYRGKGIYVLVNEYNGEVITDFEKLANVIREIEKGDSLFQYVAFRLIRRAYQEALKKASGEKT
jgi:hypothetical protein